MTLPLTLVGMSVGVYGGLEFLGAWENWDASDGFTPTLWPGLVQQLPLSQPDEDQLPEAILSPSGLQAARFAGTDWAVTPALIGAPSFHLFMAANFTPYPGNANADQVGLAIEQGADSIRLINRTSNDFTGGLVTSYVGPNINHGTSLAGQWAIYEIILDAATTNVTFRVDGVDVGTVAGYLGDMVTDSALSIGADPEGNDPCNVDLGQILIYHSPQAGAASIVNQLTEKWITTP